LFGVFFLWTNIRLSTEHLERDHKRRKKEYGRRAKQKTEDRTKSNGRYRKRFLNDFTGDGESVILGLVHISIFALSNLGTA
jgi:hypothetical protein